jgi:hypothetical protein
MGFFSSRVGVESGERKNVQKNFRVFSRFLCLGETSKKQKILAYKTELFLGFSRKLGL